MVAEEKRANVFICMQHFGTFLKLYFFLFQPGPRLELTVGLAKAGGREGRQQGEGACPSLLSRLPSLPPLAEPAGATEEVSGGCSRAAVLSSSAFLHSSRGTS